MLKQQTEIDSSAESSRKKKVSDFSKWKQEDQRTFQIDFIKKVGSFVDLFQHPINFGCKERYTID